MQQIYNVPFYGDKLIRHNKIFTPFTVRLTDRGRIETINPRREVPSRPHVVWIPGDFHVNYSLTFQHYCKLG